MTKFHLTLISNLLPSSIESGHHSAVYLARYIQRKMNQIFLTVIVIFLIGCQSNPAKVNVNNSELDAVHQLARNGNAKAQHRLCYGYSYGFKGLPKDDTKAFRWCEIASESGKPSSLTLLAEKFYLGIGVPVSYEKAFPLYKQAAEKGHKHAQYMLAQFYFLGRVVEQNTEEGMFWLIKSANQGHEGAIKLLNRIRSDDTRT